MLSRNSRLTSTSSPEVGSSRTRRDGSDAKARASDTFARIPFESSLIFRLDGSSNPRVNSAIPCLITGGGPQGIQVEPGGEPADLGDGHPVVKHRDLRHVTDPPAHVEAPGVPGRVLAHPFGRHWV